MDSQTAYDILRRCGIPLNDDFHRLTSSQVESLLAFANEHKYRKPRNANGSRARYFHAYVNRKAQSEAWASKRTRQYR